MKVRLLALILLCLSQFMHSQEGIPIYQDYLTSSWYLLHPSMAGAATTNQVRLTARKQWFDVTDAPSLVTASINGKVAEKIGVGVLAFNDQNGNFSQNGIYGTFAYHLNLSARASSLDQLSFGISAALVQRKLDERGLINPTFFDPSISGAVISDNYLNTDFGFSYLKSDFFLHATVKNAFPIQKGDFILNGNTETINLRRYIGTAGYTFSVNRDSFNLEPSILYLSTPEIKEQLVDINIKAYKPFYNGTLWGGLSYRNSLDGAQFTVDNANVDTQRFQSVSPFLGVDYKDFVFAYTYTNQLNTVKISNSGFHQITIGYNFLGNKKFRNTHWDCNCPAVN